MTTPLSSHQYQRRAGSDNLTLNPPAVEPCGGLLTAEVGEALRRAAAELAARNLSAAELDLHIKDLGRLSEKAMADGDPTGARLWADRMYAAIASRTPVHQAALESENFRRIGALA